MKRGVERDRDVVGGHDLAEMREQRGSPAASASAIERMVRPGSRPARSDSSGTNAPSTKTMRRASIEREHGAGVFGARLRGGVGRARERLGLAHQRAQVGVFPLLDAPVRQALGLEAAERGLAQRRDRARARQRALGRGEARRQRGLGRGLDRADSRRSSQPHAASSWYCA